MKKHQIVILGGGISGLSLAFYLSQRDDIFKVDVIEKTSRLGGWIDSSLDDGFFFEKGPRVFRGGKSCAFLSLLHDLKMDLDIIEASSQSKAKYLWKDGKLRRMPILSWSLLRGLWKDIRMSPCERSDESVWDFACRHFNERVAFDFFDPLVVGIYGGGVRELSIQSCFPRFKQFEELYGSILKGLCRVSKRTGPKMFGLKGGVGRVIENLAKNPFITYHLDDEVKALVPKGEGFDVIAKRGVYNADYVFSALPCQEIGKLFIPELLEIPMRGATAVQLGYDDNVLKKNGFGYLTTSGNEVLGVIFDSVVFPQFNQRLKETRLTVKLRGDYLCDEEAKNCAIKALKEHLGISQTPVFIKIIRAQAVFPQMVVGHRDKIGGIEKKLCQNHSHFQLVGNYLGGVSVNDCIERSQVIARNFLTTFE
jgi:protoporphyrinogen/coproporphyrinogen III oxidase